MASNASSFARDFSGRLLTGEADLLAYSYDGALDRGRPDAVAVAKNAAETAEAVRLCAQRGMPFTARGAGTNLSGGCIPLKGGLILSLAAMKSVLSIDPEKGEAAVEPGVVNLRFQERLAAHKRFYAPDPASYKVCTLGGNFAENSGGPRCLKYGTTTNHVLAAEVVLPDGSLERFSLDQDGPEVLSLLMGSEGTLGVATKIWTKILPVPETIFTALAAFPSLDASMECVAAIIASGTVPRVLEAMDKVTVDSIERYWPCGLPPGEAVLLIEVEGERIIAESQLEAVRRYCQRFGATEFKTAQSEADRDRLWEGRRSAYAALAALAPNVMVEDGVVPRSRLPEAARLIQKISKKYRVAPALLFHAGDGNLHPNMIFDERDKALTERTRRAGADILRACVDLGGSISGEHGIGIDKRSAMGWLFPPETLELFRAIKSAVDPQGLANPDKLFPLASDAVCRYVDREPPLSPAAQSFVDRFREKVEAGQALTVIGSGTRIPDGVKGKGETLTTRPLGAVIHIDKANFTLRAEAGISLAELSAAAAAQGVHAPVPITRGTLGGLLATRAWTGMRDHLMAMRILLPSGKIAVVGAQVAKSVAGYDVPRLLLGSWGSMAVILDATLKLYPFHVAAPEQTVKSKPPRFNRWQTLLRKAFDPDGRLNAWVGEHAG